MESPSFAGLEIHALRPAPPSVGMSQGLLPAWVE
jgi:hypothetical protein